MLFSCCECYLLDSAGDTWRLAGAFARHMLTFATSNDTSCIPPGDTWSPGGDGQRHSMRFAKSNDAPRIPLETPGDLLDPSQDICRHSLHPMIPPAFCCRHLKTCWRHPETYHKVYYIQWYLLNSTGDTWRLIGAFTRHMLSFATSNDPPWSLLETFARHMSRFAASNDASQIPLATPGALLETSQDTPQGSLHPMIPPGDLLETCRDTPQGSLFCHKILKWYCKTV